MSLELLQHLWDINDWHRLESKSLEHLQNDPDCSYALFLRFPFRTVSGC